MIEFVEDEMEQYLAKIKVIGVGGGGCNAINKMIDAGVEGVDCIAANTDGKSLRRSKSGSKIQLGRVLTKGLGAGGDPVRAKDAAMESAEDIHKALEGADMVVVAAGMGGGTGTGASPVIAEIAKKTGALTLGVVTRPFEHEGPVRKANAEDGIKALIPHVDAYVVIPNERINLVCEQDTDLFSAFARVDEVLVQAIQGISEIIHSDGVINRDFADVKRILTGKGKVMMGIGAAVGEERAKKAVQKAINSPFLEGVDISGANTILLLVSSPNMLISEYNEITAFLQKSARPGVELVPGWVRDESLKDGLRVTIIATGFEETKQEETVETVLGLENFVNSKFRTDKASSMDQPPTEALDSEILVRLSDGQYEIPAFMRRKLATKSFHN